MPEGDSFTGSKTRSDDNGEGRLWTRIRALIWRRTNEPTLREQLEETISEHEEDVEEGVEAEEDGDLSAPEREMLRNLLHFSENRVDDVMVPRSDILGLRENASFDEAVAAFAEHGPSRMPVYKDTLDNIPGMIRVRDIDRKSTRLSSSHITISYADLCLEKKTKKVTNDKQEVR